MNDQTTLTDLAARGAVSSSSPLVAGVAAAGAVGLSALLANQVPTPRDPDTGEWYHSLGKPAATPPDPVFGIVWPVIDVCLAVGGYRLMRSAGSSNRTAALAFWGFNVAMIAGWTKLFFGERRIASGAAASAAMLAAGIGYVATASKVDSVAAVAGVPFAGWVAFASYLN